MIKLEKVSKKFNKRIIFDDIDLDINHAGVYLVKGCNGAGKTTLLNIIAKISTYKGKVIRKKLVIVFSALSPLWSARGAVL